MLQWAATDPSQLGKSQADRERFAKSLGLIEKSDDSTVRLVSQKAKTDETAYDAYRAEKKSLKWSCPADFPYTTGEKSDQDYKYERQPNCTLPCLCRNGLRHRTQMAFDLVSLLLFNYRAVAQRDFKAANYLKRALLRSGDA